MKHNFSFLFRYVLFCIAILTTNQLLAQGVISANGGAVLISFDDTTPGILNGDFRANGIDANPAPGQLDDDGVYIDDFIGDAPSLSAIFGTSQAKFNNEVSNGNVSTQGIYGFNINGSRTLGIKPSYFSFSRAGSQVVFKFVNNTGVTLNAFRVQFDIFEANTGDYNTVIDAYLTNDVTSPKYGRVRASHTTTGPGNLEFKWSNAHSKDFIAVSGVRVPDGEAIYLRFYIYEGPYFRNRWLWQDEIAIDNIKIIGASNVGLLQGCSPPIAACKDVTINLDDTGNASISPTSVDDGSSAVCDLQPLSVIPNTFDCNDIGNNPVTLFVRDVENYASSCKANVLVLGKEAPTALCKNTTVQLDATGNASITTSDINNGSSNACGDISLALSQTAFTCSHTGTRDVTLTVSDQYNNSQTCTGTVTVQDNIAPTAICQDVTVQLDATGDGSTTADAVNNGSGDICGIKSLSLDKTSFDCTNVGINNTVTLTVTDNNNKTSTCPATVTVEDNIAPNALCTNVTIQLDASGNATTTAEAVGVGSNDACGILSISLNKTAYTCTDEGTNSPTLTVTDNNGNVSTCSPSITVEDNIKPIALCQDVTVQLDESGNGSTTANAVNNGSNDACGIKTLSLDNTTFSCTNVGINNTVTLTVTDNNNKTSTCSATVTVEDNVAPVVITRDLTLQLDAFGNTRAITASEINNGSNDACGIASISVSPVSFNCSNTGSNTVTLTVTDVNGKQNTGTATITVVDNRYPNAVCEDVTIQLDNNGMASVSPTDIGSNSTDNCSIATLALDIQDFGCTDFGKNTVQLTATDENGLFDICTATVTVEQSGDLPNDYSTQSIGTSDGDTFYDVCDQTFNLNATQTSPYNYKASFGEFAYTSLTGDFTFTAELESLSSNGIAGLMIRESGNPDAVMAWVGKSGYSMTGWVKMNAGDQVLRKRNGRASRIVVLKVTRTGDVITFHQGRNLLLSVQMTMNSSIQVGMYLSSKTSSQANASFKNVSYSESDIAPLNSIQLQDAIGKQSVLEQKLAAWPNPSSGEINIKSEAFVGSQAELKVYNLTGKLVYAKNLGMVYQDQYQINLQSLEAGVYIVTLESAGMLAKERIIKQ